MHSWAAIFAAHQTLTMVAIVTRDP